MEVTLQIATNARVDVFLDGEPVALCAEGPYVSVQVLVQCLHSHYTGYWGHYTGYWGYYTGY